MFFISHAVKKKNRFITCPVFLYLLADREGWGNTPIVLGQKQRKLIVKQMFFFLFFFLLLVFFYSALYLI